MKSSKAYDKKEAKNPSREEKGSPIKSWMDSRKVNAQDNINDDGGCCRKGSGIKRKIDIRGIPTSMKSIEMLEKSPVRINHIIDCPHRN